MSRKRLKSTGAIAEDAKRMLDERRRTLLSAWRRTQQDENDALVERNVEWEELAGDLRLADALDALGERRYRELREVVDALRRIDGGSYGRCEGCGGSIARRRLRVVPEARLCADCAASATAAPAEQRRPDFADRDVQSVADAVRSLEEQTPRACIRCGEPIAERRLAAQPATSTCGECSIYEEEPPETD